MNNQNWRQFLVDFIVESDAIENIQADPELVRSQLSSGWRKGHVGAFLFLEELAEQKEKLLTKEIICRVQRLITSEQHTKSGGPRLRPECIGRYRKTNVSIGGRMASLPENVPLLMKERIAKVRKWQKENHLSTRLRRIAEFHFKYERIHPFVDGNGRSGRAIVYYLMRYCGIEPFIFTSSDKYETYYRCFQEPEAMRRYFEKRTKQREK